MFTNNKIHLFILLALPAFFGCGPKTTSVTGTVTIDGKPAENIVVLFQSLSEAPIVPEPAYGITGPDGRFSLGLAHQKKNGVMPGEYVVSLSWRDPDPPKNDNLSNPCPYKIPEEATQGNFRYTVKSEGAQKADFHLVNPK